MRHENATPPDRAFDLSVHPDVLHFVSTLNEALTERVLHSGDRRWLTLYDRDRIGETLTFGQLHEGALAWAGALRGAGVEPGDRVLLILPTGRTFFESFWGVLLAGGVPVPAYPPLRLGRLEEYRLTLRGLADNCAAAALVTDERIRPLVREAAAVQRDCPCLVSPGVQPLSAPEAVAPDALGLLQYTSGSTGAQKGVMLTHASLLNNIRAIGHALRLHEGDVGVSWLPLYHDMGLIGLMMGSLYWGLPLVVCSPLDFLRRPARWLRMLSKHRGTVSAAPNFAYSLTARKVREKELEGLDLSRWRVALCGAEPIHPETMKRFNRRFAPHGLRPTAFFPAYGLAENTLAVTFSEPDRPTRTLCLDPRRLEAEGRAVELDREGGGICYVSVGRPIPTVEVEIFSPEGKAVEDGVRGEIVVRGPSVMAGYLGNPEATAAVVRDGWLCTGDLGFRHDGHFYVSGRHKDMVIKAGRNYFAEDLEGAAAPVDGVRPGGLCAFSVDNPARGTEEVVLLAETVRTEVAARTALMDEVRRRVSEVTGCRPDRVELLAPRTLPKTSSGKLQRYLARRWYLDGSLHRREGERKYTGLRVYAREALRDWFARWGKGKK